MAWHYSINYTYKLEKGSSASSYEPYQIIDYSRVAGVIESGSNSNGNYVKYGDGTMICYMNIDVTDQAINNAYGSAYQGSRTWIYPAEFKDNNVSVSCGQFQWGTSASWGTVVSADKTSTNLRGIDAFSRATGTTVKIQAIAIGRWQ